MFSLWRKGPVLGASVTPSAPPVLDARDLRKHYAGQPAPSLEGASLQLEPGEGLALLGSNGSGKTTLLSILGGALRADAGSVDVLGEPVQRPRARRLLGFVPQELALYEELTGAENTVFFARMAGLRGAALESGVRWALEAAGLLAVRDARVSSYSGGMRRRLSVVCALVHAPRLLLLDEPFSGVDEDSRERLLRLLVEQKRRGVALVLSTHRLEEVAALCDRLALLSRGRVVSERTLALAELTDLTPVPERQES